ncbi:hypothetical protein I8J29_12845 [Paenibacillus sp. MWE-103]|uniref:DUF4367 domain-containing protein n=1 Tax=Paenibacillus artemisiicola TaxID=1172618 RepID=A0ABS3WAE9_9BACL|nr:hypothetical protein [Paenibacillus artemisiicola]MBO7745090.1 hypothetical protein [Paenibacillus artemisiicola]
MNKRPFHTYEQFEEAWKNEPVPRPRLIKADIWHKNSDYPITPRRLKPLMVAAVLLCIAAIVASGPRAYAVFSRFILHDSNNNAIFEYKQSSSDRVTTDRKIEGILSRYTSKIAEAERSLKSGEAAVFFIAEAYRIDGHYFPLQQDASFTDIKQMRSRIPATFMAPSEIIPSYGLSEGTIRYKTAPVEHTALEQWDAEAQASDRPYLIKPLKLTDQVERVHFSYVDKSRSNLPIISVNVTESTGFTSTSNLDDQAEIIDSNGTEAIYEPGQRTLTFALQRDETMLQYTVLGNGFMTKKDFILAAERLIDLR